MLIVSHVIAGAGIGAAASNQPEAAGIAFFVGWISHYVLDAVPHWERLYGKEEVQEDFETDLPIRRWPKSFLYQAVIDSIISLVLAIILISIYTDGGLGWWQSSVGWGILGAMLPDLLGNVPFWNRYLEKILPFKQERQFHKYIHIDHSYQKKLPKYFGLFSQIIVIALALFVFFTVGS